MKPGIPVIRMDSVKPGISIINMEPVKPWIPVIGMVCRDGGVLKTLQEQCVSGNWSLDELSACPGRIFVDLFTMLSQWSRVWRCARGEVALRDAQLHGEETSSGVLTQTRALHRNTANVVAMREELRLHIAAFEKFRALLAAPKNKAITELFGNENEAVELDERLEKCLMNLLHHQESSAVIERQLENLLSLVEFPSSYDWN
jgi:hypothetical protein